MKSKMTLVSAASLLMLATMFQSAKPDEVMTKQDGMYVVNTTTLGKKVTGYVGATPLKVYIQKNKVVKIEALKNQETPKFFAKVKREMLGKWNGMKVNDALNAKVDGVTGATFSSEAVKDNVRLALEYYKKNK
ncbi:FMN-binding protein [Prevotella sp. E13-17]|uniref:FMN-binding protein n=1 Tax=Prevotella sp. E13-17 TaxID=2913616 RepID=UPI001EDB3F50|nr:FMN-binding protein [Prevotella sp. E13-17]UKK51587.1 FMN-binding protein [Prevotella sp. E13-17]